MQQVKAPRIQEMRKVGCIVPLLTIILILVFTISVHSQPRLKGRIFNIEDNKPVQSASIALVNYKGGAYSDSAGKFTLHIPYSKRTDSIIISSIGYEPLRISVGQALKESIFRLTPFSRLMAPIKIRSFSNAAILGTTLEAAGYFRSWSCEKKGGEIGRVFMMPQTEYKLQKVKFKVNNSCDTCMFRLHLRSVFNDYPDKEILSDSISIMIKKLPWTNDGMPEFDLSGYNIILSRKKLFIGIETLGCSNQGHSACSLSFVGTEPGNFLFKSTDISEWQLANTDYNIYMKLFLNY